jgi:hypothetical protein
MALDVPEPLVVGESGEAPGAAAGPPPGGVCELDGAGGPDRSCGAGEADAGSAAGSPAARATELSAGPDASPAAGALSWTAAALGTTSSGKTLLG